MSRTGNGAGPLVRQLRPPNFSRLREIAMISRYLIGTCALVSVALVNVPAAAKYRLHYHDDLSEAS